MRAVQVACLLTTALLIQGCGTYQYRPQDPRTISKTTSDGPVEGRPTLGHALPIPGQKTVLVPFAVESTKGLFERDDPYDRSGVSYDHAYARTVSVSEAQRFGHAGSVRWHNAIVRDLNTGEQWPILGRRGVIGQWQVIPIQPDPNKPPVSRALVFVAVLDDTNRDGLLDDRDARVAILTDADGRNPRVVTPADAHVWATLYDPSQDNLYFQVARDITGDGQVTVTDAAAPYMIAAGASGLAQRVISEESVLRLEQMLGVPTPQAAAAVPLARR